MTDKLSALIQALDENTVATNRMRSELEAVTDSITDLSVILATEFPDEFEVGGPFDLAKMTPAGSA